MYCAVYSRVVRTAMMYVLKTVELSLRFGGRAE